MAKKQPNIFEHRISKLVTITSYYELPLRGIVEFDVSSEITFPVAHQIAELLGTEDIKLSSGYSGGGCNSCGFGEEYWITVHAEGVKF